MRVCLHIHNFIWVIHDDDDDDNDDDDNDYDDDNSMYHSYLTICRSNRYSWSTTSRVIFEATTEESHVFQEGEG